MHYSGMETKLQQLQGSLDGLKNLHNKLDTGKSLWPHELLVGGILKTALMPL